MTYPGIGIVIELIGGYDPAKRFLLEAMAQGKHVVTANKALLAIHGEELFEAAARAGVDIGFEASVCGGGPSTRDPPEGRAPAPARHPPSDVHGPHKPTL